MRAEGYTVQHTLTLEAAEIVKQALVLGRRRGHAQVTPLHVGSAMMTSPTGLLRKACLQINSHPLQCKALELCFNVALNRLPTSQSSPIMLSPNQSHHPSLSNALVAAFKRALAHQRRGSIENQHQPVLSLKVEVEQLIVSILDDPSVSRVMREAGFSSTQIKRCIEQNVSMEISERPLVSPCQSKENIKPILQDFQLSSSKSNLTPKVQDDEDVMSVIDMMKDKKRKNIVVIRECLASADDIVRGVIDKFERGSNRVFPANLRFVQFVSLPLHSLGHLSREEVEDKVIELSCLVKSYVERGMILYLGDLKWVSDYWSKYSTEQSLRTCYSSPMEHMIMELSRLLFDFRDSGKLWLMGIASSKTYMNCKTGHPSLETLWNLFPQTTTVGGLELTLNFDRELPNEKKQLTCCGKCSVDFTKETQSVANCAHINESITTTTASTLPIWLQQHKLGKTSTQAINDQEHDRVGSLCKKWNSICTSFDKQPHFHDQSLHLSSSPSMSSTSLHQHHHNWPIIFDSNKIPKEHQFFTFEIDSDDGFDEENLKQPAAVKPDLLSNPNSSPNSASCSEASEDADECFLHKFKEVNSENIKILSNALEKRVPRQHEIIPEIVSTILRCRSGLTERKGKEETWLFFLGDDSQGKEMISRELATVVFGSKDNFIPIGLSCFSSTKSNSTNDDQELISKKRPRDEHGQTYIERFAEVVQENASCVFFIEDVDQVDYQSQMGIKKAIDSGRITLPYGTSVHLKDAIVILSCESYTSISKTCSPMWQKHSGSDYAMLDLNMNAEDIGLLNSVDKQVLFRI